MIKKREGVDGREVTFGLPETIGLVCYCQVCQSQRKRGYLRGEEGQTPYELRTGRWWM